MPDLGLAKAQHLYQRQDLADQGQGGARLGDDVLRIEPQLRHTAAGQSRALHLQPRAVAVQVGRRVGEGVEAARLELDRAAELVLGGGRGAGQHDGLGEMAEAQLRDAVLAADDRREEVDASRRHLEEALETRRFCVDGVVDVLKRREQRLRRPSSRPSVSRSSTRAGSAPTWAVMVSTAS